MKQISVPKAEKLLNWAEGENPDLWVNHSKVVAQSAYKIAQQCSLNPKYAYALGLVHDIGRYKGATAMLHIYDGYTLLIQEGYPDSAQICITHSFPTQSFSEYSGQNDCTDGITKEIIHILENAYYTEYDLLIQLCDSLALPEGICLMEKRLVDVAMRHGVNNYMLPKWTKLFEIFSYFESKMNVPLYSLFPDVINNTFKMN